MSKADEIITQLTRIADTLENHPRPRSWSGIYGKAAQWFNPAKLGREFEATIEAHQACFSFMHDQLDNGNVHPRHITERFTPGSLEVALANHLFSNHFTSERRAYCESIAMNVVRALVAEGMWDY